MPETLPMMAADDAVEFDPFAGGELETVVPTSEAQREVWLADRLGTEASLAFNESTRLTLRGPLQVDALCRALDGLVARHGSLRATISPDGTELLIGAAAPVTTPVVDLRPRTPADRAAALAAALDEAVRTPFALEVGPLLRTALYVLADDEHVLLMTAHHAICDGWSWGVIVTDLGALYGELLGLAPAPDAAPAYADYVAWEQAEACAPAMVEHERYWLSRFAGGEAPVLDLPTDRPRRAVRGFASERIDHVVGAPLLAAVRQLGSRAGVSLFATLVSGFAATLGRLCAQDDVVVGVPAAGQSASGMTGLVGHCVNLLPLRVAVDPALPFERFARDTSSAFLDAFEHQALTYGALLKKLAIRRDASRMPLVSVMFNLDQALHLDAESFGGLGVALAGNPRHYENFELFVNAVPVDGGLRLECQYNSDLFDAQTVRGWLRLYEQLLAAAAREPQRPLGALDWLAAADHAALQALQPPARPVPVGLMHTAFVAQAARGPERIALRDAAGRQLSYRDLDAASNALAQRLRERGIVRGDRVGLCVARSADMVVALLGVLKAGAAYVPLDPGFPAARLAFYAEDARLALLITESSIDVAPRAWRDDAGARILELDVDTGWRATDPGPLPAGPGDARPDDPAYVIYTSGSTGRPKGVGVPHRAVVNFLDSMRDEPGIGPDDRLAAVTTLSFDIAVLELLLPLAAGAEVLLVSRDEAMDGPRLARLLHECGATLMQATPGLWRMLLDTPWRGGPHFKALVGGESCPPELARALCERVGALWNMYGPTETTVWSTCWRVDPAAATVSIGRPIANTTVWVLDDRQAACPVGVPGELCIGGAGLAIGYLDRPELDAERFIVDPQDASGQRRLYRTGDRGRWRRDGLLEHLGRLDFQVKLRGYRIELGEIEAVAAAQPGVGRSVAIVREDEPGDARLVLYLTRSPGAASGDDDVLAGLRARLPDYMLPQHLVWVDALPALPNGKIDRRALPRPAALAAVAAAERIGPRNQTEQQVLAVMEEVLKLPGLGVHDNFFSVGGHSLLAARLVTRLSAALALPVPLRAVFEAPTAERLAQWVGRLAAGDASDGWRAIRHDPTQTRGPLSLMQQRLWFLERLNPGRLTYHTPSAHRLRGPLDPVALERALQELVRRQPVLRTRFGEVDGVPYQEVLDTVEVALRPLEDLSGCASAEREAELLRRMQALADEPFDFSRAPLWRARLYRLDSHEHVLFFMPHHLVWDGWSFDLFYDEMAALYAGFEAGATPGLAPLALSYGDFARWQRDWLRGAELQRQVAPWRASLAPLPEPLDLPLDRARPAQLSGAGATEWIHLPLSVAEAVRRLARQHEATPFMVLLAVFALLLQRLSAQHDLVVGTPVRGRPVDAVEKLMGFFVNVLPLRLGVDAGLTFGALLDDVRRRVLAAFSHADVPFEELVHALDPPRDPSRSALYQAFFSYQDARDRQRRWGRLAHEQVHLFQRGAAEDIGLWLLEHPEGLSGGFTYSTDLFDPASVRGFADGFERLLESVLAAPTRPVALLDAVTTADRERLRAWNRRQVEHRAPETVDRLLAAAFERHGPAIALVAGDVTLTYAELGTRVRRLAARLRGRGAAPGARIGLLLERGVDMLVAQLAILETGAAYVPLDPAFPADRLAYMQDDAGLALLVTSPALERLATIAPSRRVHIGADSDAETPAGGAANLGGPRAAAGAGPDDPAYVIYTSGSTGRPKGVVVPHRAVVNFLLGMAREPGLAADDRLVAVTTLSFDIAVLELLLPLIVGARVIMAVADAASDGHRLRQLLDTAAATVLQATPSTWRMLIDAGWSGAPRFKALVGGEPLPADLAVALQPRCGELWNLYGPTETTVWSTCWRVDDPAAGISIGRPIDNTQVWVLDEHLQLCPPGVPGELCIGGDGVALGYLDRPELTAERFIDDPFSPGARLYRTGDRGRWRRDGLLEHLGRLDFQVKVRGYRIELGEVEAGLVLHEAVAQAVVVAHRWSADDVRLVAYVVPAKGARVDAAALRAHLRRRLPDYMLPQHVVEIAAMPLLPNGKIDRKALVLPTAHAPAPVAPTAPSNDRERLMWQVWRELLGHDTFGVGDDFFDIGGHSMLALRLMSMIEQRFDRRLPLSALLQASTVRSLTEWMALQQSAQSPLEIRAGSADEPALFLAHDGDGETLLYRGLAHRLRRGRRVYGLPPLSKAGCALAHTRLQEMAAHHVQRIRSVQAHGPYLVGGLCAGGVIAFEIARQLREAGESVPLVALLDIADVEAAVRTSFVHGRRLKRIVAALQNDDGISMGNHLSRSVQRVGRKVRNFLVYSQESRAQQSDTERRARLLERALDRGDPPPAEVAALTVRQIYFFARDRYVPPTAFDGDVLLVRATSGDGSQGDIPCVEMYSDPLFDWQRRVTGQVRVVDVPGGHSTMLQEPHVDTLAAVLQRAIDDALSGTRPAAGAAAGIRPTGDPSALAEAAS